MDRLIKIILIISLCSSMATMPMKRLFSLAPLTQTRTLIPGGKRNSEWSKVNIELEEFQAQYDLKFPISDEDMKFIDECINAKMNIDFKIKQWMLKCLRFIDRSPVRFNFIKRYRQKIEENLVVTYDQMMKNIRPSLDLINALLKKHKISDPIQIEVWEKLPNNDAIACVQGSVLMLSRYFFTLPHNIQIATIEHEICHILHKDSYLGMDNAKKLDYQGRHTYTLLMEQRADAYSMLQSLNNAKILEKYSAYALQLQELKIQKYLAAGSPSDQVDPRTEPNYAERILKYMEKKARRKK